MGLAAGVPNLVLARRFGIPNSTLRNHRERHLSPQMRAALALAMRRPDEIDLEALSKSEAEGLLGNLISQRARLQQLSELCIAADDRHGAISVEARVLGNLELTGKLLGELVSVHEHRHASVLVSPDYIRLRQVLSQTLRAFPDAAAAVSAALAGIEQDAAADITRAGKPVMLEAVPCS